MSKSISLALVDVNSGREQTSLLIKTFVNYIKVRKKVPPWIPRIRMM